MLLFWWIWIRDIRSKWILIISWKRNINFECDKVLCVILWKIVYKCVFFLVCCMCVKLDCGPTKLTRCPFAHLSMDEFFFSSVFGVFLFVCISTVNKLLKGEKKIQVCWAVLLLWIDAGYFSFLCCSGDFLYYACFCRFLFDFLFEISSILI